jgi:hypothetical protein
VLPDRLTVQRYCDFLETVVQHIQEGGLDVRG